EVSTLGRPDPPERAATSGCAVSAMHVRLWWWRPRRQGTRTARALSIHRRPGVIVSPNAAVTKRTVGPDVVRGTGGDRAAETAIGNIATGAGDHPAGYRCAGPPHRPIRPIVES